MSALKVSFFDEAVLRFIFTSSFEYHLHLVFYHGHNYILTCIYSCTLNSLYPRTLRTPIPPFSFSLYQWVSGTSKTQEEMHIAITTDSVMHWRCLCILWDIRAWKWKSIFLKAFLAGSERCWFRERLWFMVSSRMLMWKEEAVEVVLKMQGLVENCLVCWNWLLPHVMHWMLQG